MTTPEEHAEHNAEAEQQIVNDVAQYGFHVAIVPGDGYSPTFAYTIGLFKSYGYPELICFGLSHDLMHSMFWTAKELFDQQPNPDLSVGYPDFIGDFDVRFLQVDKARYADYLGYGHWFYQSWEFPVLQIVWPDKQANFPWDEDFNPDWKSGQTLLDRDSDFKFREERNVAVFTTKQVLEGMPILRVIHDTEGDWQFLCDTSYELADLKVVALESIVKRDRTVNELFQLNCGWQAFRDAVGDKWRKEEHEVEEDGTEDAEGTE
ncbi:DUF4262 domain-containing protein [Hymenobacter sp. BT523]|uniref:DUF4262 domain-containing protein n=1 Tax=Hymenobacter sp. BT523 TaxID=2795725 RepID=UPI0018EACCE7|nr:DUF4262 domain-containing protein [Hymenobacter sp. BT523]MBJ6109723.1 DUF4262 domain-containing protein [Hymenobacter sp. BT523]